MPFLHETSSLKMPQFLLKNKKVHQFDYLILICNEGVLLQFVCNK